MLEYLPATAMIPEAKLTQYLLMWRARDDKSQFLERAGYTQGNWTELELDLRRQILTQPATWIESTRYGEKYRIRAGLRGPNGVELDVVTIWMVTPAETRFVTLVPAKGDEL